MKKIADVARILDVHYNTVVNWIKAEKIKAVKVGRDWRVDDEEIERIKQQGLRNEAV